MNKLTVYYAHCLVIYNTEQEARDIQVLEDLGFEVINPNTEEVDKEWCLEREIRPYEEAFTKVFGLKVNGADVFAFRALPDGGIPKGIHREWEIAVATHKPVIELPSGVQRRALGVAETREYLKEIGQR